MNTAMLTRICDEMKKCGAEAANQSGPNPAPWDGDPILPGDIEAIEDMVDLNELDPDDWTEAEKSWMAEYDKARCADKEPTDLRWRWTTIGSVCGTCNHAHRSRIAAEQCLAEHGKGCAENSPDAYSDRRIIKLDDARAKEAGESVLTMYHTGQNYEMYYAIADDWYDE